MKLAILSGGPEAYLPAFSHPLLEDVSWVGVDRGTLTLLNHGLTPIRAFGDFDSVTLDEWQTIQKSGIPLETYTPEKDATDLELALDWALEQAPEVCYLVGATGGRLDHSLMNLQLLVKGVDHATSLFLVDKQNIVTLLKSGSYNIVKRPDFDYISFIAYTPKVSGLTLDGFKYNLKEHVLNWGSSLCISNVLTDPHAVVCFEEGLLLLVQSRDEI